MGIDGDELGRLEITVDVDPKGEAKRDIDRLEKDTRRTARSTDRQTRRMGRAWRGVSRGIGIAAKAIAGLGIGAAAAGIAAVAGLTKHYRDLNQELRPAANRIGATTAELNTLRRVAERLGSEDPLEGITDSAQELGLRLQTVTADGYQADEALRQIGLSGDELRQKTPTEALLATIDALQQIEDQQERNIKADDLFGGQWENIAGILNASTEQFAALTAEEGKNEAQIQKNLDAAQRFDDAWNRVKNTLEGFTATVAAPVLTFLAGMFEQVHALIPVVQGLFSRFQDDGLPVLQQVGGYLQNAFLPIFQNLQEFWANDLHPILSQLWSDIQNDLIPALTNAAEVIGTVLQPAFQAVLSILQDVLIPYLQGTVVNTFKIIGGVIQIVSGVLTGDWQKAWLGVRTVTAGVVKQVINLVQGMTNAVATAVEGVIRSIGRVAQKIPVAPQFLKNLAGFTAPRVNIDTGFVDEALNTQSNTGLSGQYAPSGPSIAERIESLRAQATAPTAPASGAAASGTQEVAASAAATGRGPRFVTPAGDTALTGSGLSRQIAAEVRRQVELTQAAQAAQTRMGDLAASASGLIQGAVERSALAAQQAALQQTAVLNQVAREQQLVALSQQAVRVQVGVRDDGLSERIIEVEEDRNGYNGQARYDYAEGR